MRLYAPVLMKISCSSWAVNTSSAATRGDGVVCLAPSMPQACSWTQVEQVDPGLVKAPRPVSPGLCAYDRGLPAASGALLSHPVTAGFIFLTIFTSVLLGAVIFSLGFVVFFVVFFVVSST